MDGLRSSFVRVTVNSAGSVHVLENSGSSNNNNNNNTMQEPSKEKDKQRRDRETSWSSTSTAASTISSSSKKGMKRPIDKLGKLVKDFSSVADDKSSLKRQQTFCQKARDLLCEADLNVSETGAFDIIAKVVKLVVAAMFQFSEELELQRYGCGILSKILLFGAVDDHHDEDTRYAQQVVNSRGLELWLSAIVEFPEDLSIHVSALTALQQLTTKCCNGTIQKRILDLGGLTLLHDVLESFSDNAEKEAQEIVKMTQQCISSLQEVLVRELDESKMTTSLTSATVRPRDPPWAVDRLLDLEMSKEENFGIRAGFDDSPQICHFLVKLITKNTQYSHSSEKKKAAAAMITKCCKLLAALTFHHDANKTRFVQEAGAPNAVVGAMKNFPQYRPLQLRGCRAFLNLLHGDDNKLVVLRAGAVEVLLQALQLHPDDERIQEEASAALSNLANSADRYPEIKTRLLENNPGGKILQQVHVRFRDQQDKTIVKYTSRALARLHIRHDNYLKEGGGGGRRRRASCG